MQLYRIVSDRYTSNPNEPPCTLAEFQKMCEDNDWDDNISEGADGCWYEDREYMGLGEMVLQPVEYKYDSGNASHPVGG